MSHLVTLFERAEQDIPLPLASLDLGTLEGLLLAGTMVIVVALILIAANRKRSPHKAR